jgi:CubicO group peptidase (beta-lactamase class C family)
MLLFLPSMVSLAQQSKDASLPDTPIGKHVEAYVNAFNGGEKAMRDFFLHHTSKDALEKVTVEQRLERYRQMHERLGSLELRTVNETGTDHLSALFHTANGSLVNVDFAFEKSAPFGLLGIRVEDVARGGENIPADHKKDNAGLIRAVEQYAAGLAKDGQFSGAILLTFRHKTIFEHAYGYADREKRIPNTIDTRFNLGSINKSFTALAIRQLAGEGKLSLSDPVKKFLPDYPNKEAAERVTIQELLDMTSGIGDFFGDRYVSARKENLRTLQAYLPLFADKPLEFEPGTKHRYSNGGFVVLGLVIEKASGMDYYAYVRKNIFLPAGMTHTDSFEKDSLPADCAVGYTGDGSSRKPNHETLPEKGSSAGGGYSTVEDLLNYTVALEKRTITPSNFDQRGGFGIAGGAPGLNAALEWDPQSGYVIVVMSNFDPPTAENMARHIRSWLPTGQ